MRDPFLKGMDAIELLNELGRRVIPGDEDPSGKFLGMAFELVDALETDGLARAPGLAIASGIGSNLVAACEIR